MKKLMEKLEKMLDQFAEERCAGQDGRHEDEQR
jgi:hypothetical protein